MFSNYLIIEYAATLLELFFIYWISILITNYSKQGKIFEYKIIIPYVVNFIVITLCNMFESYSWITIAVSLIMLTISIRYWAGKSWILSSLAVITSFLILHSISYIYSLIIPFLTNGISDPFLSFYATLTPGWQRIIFICIADLTQFIIIMLSKPLLQKLSDLEKRSQFTLLIVFFIFYIIICITCFKFNLFSTSRIRTF